VDALRRREVRKHHTATHLLQAALRGMLGSHVSQRGSLVAPDHLRFDFSHFERVTPEQLRELEQRINEVIQRNIEAQIETDVPIEEARTRGAMMFFGEKYGDTVRVVTFDPSYSVELCGGTHVGATGEIGLFQFVTEGSIASGVRRVEAVVGQSAVSWLEREKSTLEEVRSHFRTLNRPLEEEVAGLIAQARRLEKELESMREQALAGRLDAFVESAVTVEGVRVAFGEVDAPDMNLLRTLGERLRQKLGAGSVGILGSANKDEGKVYLVASVSDDLVSERGLKAGDLVGILAARVGGGGGGRPHLATAGGRKPEALPDTLRESASVVRDLLSR
jgi:alanyl-tRNA synthetase